MQIFALVTPASYLLITLEWDTCFLWHFMYCEKVPGTSWMKLKLKYHEGACH